MLELNKFLDLDGLKIFWDQINEKKQNRTIWYNGEQVLLEDCLNTLKTEIENVQKKIGNIEELDQINGHIEKIQSTLQEIDNQLNNLEENYVPESRTIAGINLTNNIQTSALKNALGINSIENILNGNIKKENLSTEFMETGQLNNCLSISSRDGVYRALTGTYTILNNLCILNVGTTTFSDWWNLYFDLPVSPTDLTAEYFSEIYVIDSSKDICSISIDPTSNRLAIMPGPKGSNRGFTGDNELHFIFMYRIS